jgi:phage/plasmid primase-like uncharacterized protein
MRAQQGGRLHPAGGRIIYLPADHAPRLSEPPPPTRAHPADHARQVDCGVLETSTSERANLASALGLDHATAVPALIDLAAFRVQRRRLWCFPMRDATGKVVGLRTRTDTGEKRATRGSREGLFFAPSRLRTGRGPVFIPEGPTSTLALLTLGHSVVGRPSAWMGRSASGYACELLRDRDVVVLGENDAKPDRSWPGRDGAAHAARALLPYARSVRVAFPPASHKDVRDAVRAGMTAADVWRLAESGELASLTIGVGRW